MGEHCLRDSFICAFLCGRWRPPSVPDSPIRHGSDPSLSCPASPGRHSVVLAGVQGLFLLFSCLHILCVSGQSWLGRISPQVWECSLCYPPLGEGVLSSLDRCPGRTVPPWLLVHMGSGRAVPQWFLLPSLSRWLSSGSRAAVAAA